MDAGLSALRQARINTVTVGVFTWALTQPAADVYDFTVLDRLNAAWYTTFWSHTFTDWRQIEPPSALTEHWRGPDHTAFQGITLDYLRFLSDAMLANFRDEEAAIRESDPDTPVATNLMGMYRPLDHHRWAPRRPGRRSPTT